MWFEAGGLWSHHGIASPYSEVSSAVGSGNRDLAPDIVVSLRSSNGRAAALIAECKYSESASYVASGYDQACAYALELQSRAAVVLGGTAPGKLPLTAVVVPAEGMAADLRLVEMQAGRVGFCPPSELPNLVGDLLSEVS
jgi:hypothetical protein